MKMNREYLMKMMNIEPRRSLSGRFASGLGLFIGGALVGAGVALLMAPKSGAELRKELADGSLGPILHKLDGSMANNVSESSPRA